MRIINNKHKTTSGLLILSALLLLTSFSSAERIGVSPASTSFVKVLRGGYSEQVIIITVDSVNPVIVELDPRGEIEEWLNFSEETFEVSRDAPYRLIVSASPPNDIPNGNYTGFLRVKSISTKDRILPGQATGIVTPVLDLSLEVEITDLEFFSCRAGGYTVNSVEEGEILKFRSKIFNQGNTRINPKVRIDIWDQEQIGILKSQEYSTDFIAPTTEKEIEIEVETSDLPIDQYWVDVLTVDCNMQETLTFDILEEGSLRAAGNLVKISTPPWVDVRDTTFVEVEFENTGEKDVEALFKGRITKGDKTIQLIESEKIDVQIGALEKFEFFFTPTSPGKYIVSGRVFYDNKRTFEKSAVINVKPTGIGFGTIMKFILYILLIAGIIVLTYKIRQEKKIYRLKLKRLKR